MGETTGIAWTDSTINVWHGCTKVDELCRHCYAEVSTPVRVKRAAGLEVWGPNAARSETKGWEASLRKWDRAARASGDVHRVFGQSLSDTFEDYRNGNVIRATERPDCDLFALRAKFLDIIGECDALTFQLLTKRPENVTRMVPPSWLEAHEQGSCSHCGEPDEGDAHREHECRVLCGIRRGAKGPCSANHRGWPAHVWIGTSVGDVRSKARIDALRTIPAPVRFLSIEPQIEDVGALDLTGISWVIVGGESGPRARPFDLAWARDIVRQCRAAGVACFVKQMGAHPWDSVHLRWRLRDSHGGDPSEWPPGDWPREFPTVRRG